MYSLEDKFGEKIIKKEDFIDKLNLHFKKSFTE
jgi:hypothetical protein